MHSIFIKILNKFASLIYYSSFYWYYKSVFGEFGNRTVIKSKGLRLENPANIFLGHRVFVGQDSWLAASPHLSSSPRLFINDGVSIGRFNQIYSTTSITIEKNVLTADRVYISDSAHDSSDILVPIMNQNITAKGPMTIGEGSWIGINACIIGASIGKNCVIGANSVVVKDIPDYCIVGGIPAVVIKRYNKSSQKWEKTTKDGEFI